MKALVADDSRVARRMLRSLIGELASDIEIDHAADGVEAAAMHAVRGYDMLFLDATMPKMTGLEALERIRQTDSEVLVVLLSSSDDDAMLERAQALNATAFISKPFSSLDVQAALQLLTGRAPAVRVLMIDDSRAQRAILRTTLAGLQIETAIDEAEDGAQGLRKALSHSYDLVFLDVNMPRLSGEEVLREIKQAQARAKVVMLSADMEAEFQGKFAAMGADACLPKPIAAPDVLKCLSEMLDVRRPTRRPTAA